MHKKFNITGVCIPEKHYMVDTSNKISAIKTMVEQGDYFVINRPRQYGKTTTLYLLRQDLKKDSHYLVIATSFEGIDEPTHADQKLFIPVFLDLLKKSLAFNKEKELIDFINSQNPIQNFNSLSNLITELVVKSGRQVVFIIDEVDKASNNRLFLDFLGMLRTKYLDRNQGQDHTFHSVILAGVHDVKTLKSQIRPDEEKKFNSPWNIAADFEVDISFSSLEIQTMLNDYVFQRQVHMDIPLMAEKLFYFTSGYPFLVSQLCKILDEKVMPAKGINEWREQDLEEAVQITLKKDNTNFESLIKNLENNKELYDFVFKLILGDTGFVYNTDNPVIKFGVMYGILKEENGRTKVHNRLYEQRIYNYMASKMETSTPDILNSVTGSYLDETGKLDIKKVLSKFQAFIKEEYGEKDRAFIERNGRLLFLAFLRPIINGRGFDFKEVQVSEERRLDIVITFDNIKYIIELKLWRGDVYHQEGIRQLCDYLDRQNQASGYLLIYDLRKESGQTGKSEIIAKNSKTIFAAWV
jgi:hypothetical protein